MAIGRTILKTPGRIFQSRPEGVRKGGFTLIELMVVIVLIGILSAMIIPEMRGTYEEALLRSSSRQLVEVFTLAYSRAVSLNQLHLVRLDPKTGHYRLESASRQKEPGSASARDIPGGDGQVDSRIRLEIRTAREATAEPGEAQVMPPAGENGSKRGDIVAFYPDGTADACEIRLRDRQGFRLALRIDPATARVRVLELEHE